MPKRFGLSLVVALIAGVFATGCDGTYMYLEMQFKGLPEGSTPVPCLALADLDTAEPVGKIICDGESEAQIDAYGRYQFVFWVSAKEDLAPTEGRTLEGTGPMPFALVDGVLYRPFKAEIENRDDEWVSMSQFVISPEYRSEFAHELR
jgi:hypothetical protein